MSGTDKGLESERRYTTRVLPAGVVRGVRDAVLGRAGRRGPRGRDRGRRRGGGRRLSGRHRAGPQGRVTFTVAPIERVPDGHGDGRGGRSGMTARSGPVPILMYHAVAHCPAKAAYGLSVSPDAFADQMELLGRARVHPGHHGPARRTPGARAGALPTPPRPDHLRRRLRGRAPPRPARPRQARLRLHALRLHGLAARRPRRRAAPRTPCSTGTRCASSARRGTEIGGHSHSHPAAGPTRRRAAVVRDPALQGDPRRRTGPAPVSFAYPVRLLQPPGAAHGALRGVRPGARRGQRARPSGARARTPWSG